MTKYRRHVFNDSMLTDCDNTLRDVGDVGAELVEFNGESDHAHQLVSYRPRVAISDLVRRWKCAEPRPMRADYTGRRNRAPYIENQARPL